MCGVTGVFDISGSDVSSELIENMLSEIAHRGPDDSGVFTDGPLALGHRRLSIIDLSSAAHQPMSDESGRYTIVYNGETYNFRELRKELEKEGCVFKSSSDTEVVLKSFIRWGSAALDRFNGMFVFAVWDSLEKKLFLARDRYGIKPLYYTERDGKFIFASEIKSILKHPSCRSEIDYEALLEYFTFQNFFTDRTLFKDIKLFPPGHFAEISSSGFKKTRYWDFSFEESVSPKTEKEYEEELDFLFRQAVERQLVSDVELGAYLSGGVDSGSITAIAAERFPFLKSFTCGFDMRSASGLELGFDERENAEYMSYLFKTEHYELVLKSGDMERVLPRFTRHLEEPRVGQSYPNFYVAQLAGKFVKVVLSGTGGDELFGGYPWRYYRALSNDNFEDYIDKYYAYWQRLIPNTLIKEVFKPVRDKVKDVWTRDIFRNVFDRHAHKLTRPEDYINHSLYFEAKTFLHGLLVMEDKLSMAHGLESRVPFLDNDLVDFAMKLPVSMKLGNLGEVLRMNENEAGPKSSKYYTRTKDGKRILRKVMSRYVPEDISNAVKQGFSAPDAGWFKGDSIEFVKKKLLRDKARIYEFFDRKSIDSLIREHIDGKQNRRLLIWSLLNFEQWCETFLT